MRFTSRSKLEPGLLETGAHSKKGTPIVPGVGEVWGIDLSGELTGGSGALWEEQRGTEFDFQVDFAGLKSHEKMRC